MSKPETEFDLLLAADRRAERRLAWGELVAIILTLAVVFWRLRAGP